MSVELFENIQDACDEFLYEYIARLPLDSANVILVPNEYSIILLKKIFFKNKINFDHITFHTADGLRILLSQKLLNGISISSPNVNDLIFSEINVNNIHFSYDYARQFVQACDEFLYAGARFRDVLSQENAKLAESFYVKLNKMSIFSEAQIDIRLFSKEGYKIFDNVLCYGFDVDNINLIYLIESCVKCSKKSDFVGYNSSDLSVYDVWLSILERIFNSEAKFSANKTRNKFFDIANKFQLYKKSDCESDISFCIFNNIFDEASNICAKINEVLLGDDQAEIAVVVDDKNEKIVHEIRKELIKCKIFNKNDEVLNIDDRLRNYFKAWCAWQTSHNVNDFLKFLSASVNINVIDSAEFGIISDVLISAAFKCVTYDCRVIFEFVKANKSTIEDVASVFTFEILPERMTISTFIDVIKSTFNGLFSDETFSAIVKLFCVFDGSCEFLTKELLNFALCELRHMYKLCDNATCNALDRVIILEARDAADYCFTNVIRVFTKSKNSCKNFFLESAEIDNLNDKFYKKTVSIDQNTHIIRNSKIFRLSALNSFTNVIANVKNSLSFSSLGEDIDDFYKKIYFCSTGKFLSDDEIMRQSDMFSSNFGAVSKQNDKKKSSLWNADFNIGDVAEKVFSCKEWEEIFRNPKLAFYEIILELKRFCEINLPVLSSICVGNITHELMDVANKLCIRVPNFYEFCMLIDAKASKILNRLAVLHDACNMKLPKYINCVLCSSKLKAKKLANVILRMDKFNFFTTEYVLPDYSFVNCNNCKIPVKGCIDAVFSENNFFEDKNSEIIIVDFKTGNDGKFFVNKLSSGIGVQIALYALAMFEHGYRNIKILLIKPDSDVGKLSPIDISNVFENIEFLQMIAKAYKNGIVNTTIDKFTLSSVENRMPTASRLVL